ncbi:phage tail tube protein [Rhodopila sp.]|uniref:phage tail tube protein n=1 Tax=Rhodopila sp. TaxID=2480087 RepID=UPI003D0E4208
MPNVRLAGIVAMTIDGDTWDVTGDAAYGPSTVTRETLKGQSRVEGFSEMPMQGYIAATLRARGDTTVYSLNGKTSTTIVLQLANGITVYGANMWQVGEIEVRTQEGSFAIRFEGDSVTESTI